MNNEPIALENALIGLYSYTRKANIPLDDHDMCRAYVDVLAQALNIKLEWNATPNDQIPVQDTPKQVDLLAAAKQQQKKR